MYASAWVITKSAEIESNIPAGDAPVTKAKSDGVDVEELAI